MHVDKMPCSDRIFLIVKARGKTHYKVPITLPITVFIWTLDVLFSITILLSSQHQMFAQVVFVIVYFKSLISRSQFF